MDIQINGAYGFDFSVYEGDDEAYSSGLKTVAEKIVETGVTSCVCPRPVRMTVTEAILQSSPDNDRELSVRTKFPAS